jgi:hypothetical protein
MQMMQSNQPYQRVNTQEENNSTLYRNMAMDAGINVSIAGAMDAFGVFQHKSAKTPAEKKRVHDMYFKDYSVKETAGQLNDLTDAYFDKRPIPEKFFDGKVGSKIGKLPVPNSSSKLGRIVGYGGGLLGGMVTGAIRTELADEN